MTKESKEGLESIAEASVPGSGNKSEERSSNIPEVKMEQKKSANPPVSVPDLSKAKVSVKSRAKKPKVESFSKKEKLKSWYHDRYQSVVVQRNILLLFSLMSMVAVTVCVIFVKSITASKSLDPYVIEVEEKTGIPVVVEQLSTEYLTGNQMIIRYFLNQYIQAASGYDPRLYKLQATQVRLLSTSDMYSSYLRRISPRVLGGDGKIDVRIKSIQFPAANMAQVRLLRVIKIKDSVTSVNELINIEFVFKQLTMNSEERLINPLGFQVGKYLVTEEVYEY